MKVVLLFVLLYCVASAFADDVDSTLERLLRALITKRQGNCPAKYRNVKSCKAGHSRCLYQGRYDITDRSEQAEILRLHNKYRATVKPPASDMLKLTWDAELAKGAAGWVGSCPYTKTKNFHDQNECRGVPKVFVVGQNAAYWPGKDIGWKEVVKMWYSEFKDFTLGVTPLASPQGPTGHYVQLVWAKTHKVGCAKAQCGKNWEYMCNYGPAGFYPGKYSEPYEQGPQGSQCQQNSGGLCSCPGDCKGYLDAKTCDCDVGGKKALGAFFGGAGFGGGGGSSAVSDAKCNKLGQTCRNKNALDWCGKELCCCSDSGEVIKPSTSECGWKEKHGSECTIIHHCQIKQGRAKDDFMRFTAQGKCGRYIRQYNRYFKMTKRGRRFDK